MRRIYEGYATLNADPSYVLVLWRGYADERTIDVCRVSGDYDWREIRRLATFKELRDACNSIERKTQGYYKVGEPVLDFEWQWENVDLFMIDKTHNAQRERDFDDTGFIRIER